MAGGDSQDASATSQSGAFETWLERIAEVPSVAPPLPDLAVGTILAGRFTIHRLLGRGGMGVVYAALDRRRGMEVAVKTLRTKDADALVRLRREFRDLHRLHHPNLVGLGELFEEEGRSFFTMELLHGVNVIEHVRTVEGGFDELRLREAFADLVRGLRALHRDGKVHRDVKPSNTLVTDDGRARLLDFGLVTDTETREAHHAVGTAAYMAPEQARGEPALAAADWYALGVMLMEALTGARCIAPDIARGALPNDLVELAAALLSESPEKRPDGVEILRVLGGRTSGVVWDAPHDPAFVGREASLALLDAAMTRSRAGSPVVVHLAGESGIGKSTLLAAFARRNESRALVLEGRCFERDHVAYKALDQVAESMARALDGADSDTLRRALDDASLVFPSFARGSAHDVHASRSGDSRALRRLAFAGVRAALEHLAQTRPVIVALDDVQWADADSFALLESLLAGRDAPSVLYVLAARADWDALPLTRLPIHTRHTLGPIETSEAEALARSMLDLPDAQAHLLGPLVVEANGHPFLLTQIVRHAAQSDARAQSIGRVLVSRLHALTPNERRVCEIASLAAEPMRLDVLGAACGLAPTELDRALRRLEQERMIRASLGSGRVEPYHDTLRRAWLGALEPERAHTHQVHLAEALTRHDPDAAESIARAWVSAGERARAFPHAVRAAEGASRQLAFERAAELCLWALELGHPEGEARVALLRMRGDALADAGRGYEAARAYEEALPSCDDAARAALEQRAAEQLLRSGHVEAGLVVLDRVLARFGMRRPKNDAAGLVAFLGERARIVLPKQRAAPSAEGALDACWAASMFLSQIDPIASAFFQSRHLRLARERDDAARIALGLSMDAIVAATQGRPATRAHALLDRARLIAPRDDARVDAYLSFAETNVAFLEMRWARALALAERTLAAFRASCVGVAWEVATTQRFALTCLWHLGRTAALQTQLEPVLDDARARGDRYALVQLRSTVSPVVRLLEDDVAAASGELDAAQRGLDANGMRLQRWQIVQGRVLVDLYAGQPERALARLDASLSPLARTMLFRIQAIRAVTRFVTACALLGAARTDEARRPAHLTRARALVRALRGEGFGDGAVALLAAQVAALEGRLEDVQLELRAAVEGLERDGMSLACAAAAHALAQRETGTRRADMQAIVDRAVTGQGIACPERLFRIWAPALS